MALIDKETIRAEIERRKDYISVTHFAEELLAFLDSLPEQPKLKPHTQSGIPPLDYYQGIMAGRSDVIDHPEQYGLQKTIKTKKSNRNHRKSFIAMCHKELLQSLQEAIDLCFDYGLTPYKDGNQWCVLYGENIQDGIVGFGDTRLDAMLEFKKEYDSYVKRTHLYPTKEQPVEDLDYEKEIYRRFGQIKNFTFAMEVAKQFYELGCRRTAEMYDEIEYNRQRAEEAELSEDLEEEIKRWIHAQRNNGRKLFGWIDMVELAARHFYELGQKSKKPERNVVTREEAVKILKDMHDKALFSVRNALETLVPELAESDVLDEEIKRYFKGWTEDYEGVCHYQRIRLMDCYGIARHFAEWGAKHLK